MFTFLFFQGYSQFIEKFSIDSGGASATMGSIQILYTIGEVAVREISTPTVSVSEGFISSGIGEPLSINDNQLSDINISIYPNPTNGYLYITTDIVLSRIELFDVLGKRVCQYSSFQSPIEVLQFKPGIYFLKLFKNEKFLVKRIIIQ